MKENSETDGVAFWEHALNFYNQPGAKEVLLDYQDRLEVDVMASLWALSAAVEGRSLNAEDVNEFFELTNKARMEASRLRKLRRKAKSDDCPEYQRLQIQELAAERAVASSAPPINSVGKADIFDENLGFRNLKLTLAISAPKVTHAEIWKLTKIIIG